jgi:flavin reductase (DIM6/NTAB) family NADH-FMN oxidoreductase RutF
MDEVTEKAFHAYVARLDYPMFVVTTSAGDERSGCLIGFATQCSIDPIRFMVWISKKNHTFGVAQRANAMGVHSLAQSQRHIAELFGGTTGDEIDKFERCAWHEGPEGVPILDEVAGWFVGTIVDRLDTGDHLGHLLEPIAAAVFDIPNLTYQDIKGLEPGHAP